MTNKKIFLALIWTLFVILCPDKSATGQDSGISSKKLSLLFIGDIMGHDEQIWAAEDRRDHTYHYDTVFTHIRPLISEADVAIANFEVTLAGVPYKGYPQFSSPAALAAACKKAGIDVLVTANNHAADRGPAGIAGTINRLDSLGITHTGTFIDAESENNLQPLIINKNGFKIALLNYTYGTNGITVKPPLVVNTLDKTKITEDLQKARNLDPDLLILFLHWGTEYDTVPSKTQYDLADYFFSHGADIIIGSHPHVIQKMEWSKKDITHKDKVIAYSLGNFLSNQRKPKTDGGLMARIEVKKENDSVFISNTGYYLTWVYTPIVRYRKYFFVLPCSEFENNPRFFSNPADFTQMKKFIGDSRMLLYRQNINFRENIRSGNGWILN